MKTVEEAAKEIFRPISGYDGLYEISNLGNIKSLKRKSGNNKNTSIRILSSSVNKHGYCHISLTNLNGIRVNHSVHRLVAFAFIEKDSFHEGCEVNHIDGNKSNNRHSNLEFCSRSENMIHSFRSNLRKPTAYWTGKRGVNHHSSRKVRCTTDNNEFDSISEAADFYNLRSCSISLVCRFKLKQTGGRSFEFILPTGDQ